MATAIRVQNQQRFDYGSTSFVQKAKEVVRRDNIAVFVKANCHSRFTERAIRSLSGNTSRHVLGPLRLLAPIRVGLAVKSIVDSAGSIKNATTAQKVEASLGIAIGIGVIGDSMETFISGLQGLDLVKPLAWAPPLLAASVGLQAISIPLEIKKLVHTHRFKKVFIVDAGLEKETKDYTLADYQRGLKLIEEKEKQIRGFFSSHFTSDVDKCIERLLEIEAYAEKKLAASDPNEVLKGKETLQTAMKALSQRITIKKWSHILSLLSTTIELIGVALIFTPLAPIGFALIAVGSGIWLATYVFKKVMEKKFTANFYSELV